MRTLTRKRSITVTLALLMAAGCATTKVTPDAGFGNVRLAKPDRILVCRFAASSGDLDPSYQGVYAEPSTPPTPDQVALGQKLGTEVANRLVEDINDMGMHAEGCGGAAPPQLGDIVLRGHFASVDEGSTLKRMTIGFGSGKADLKTVVDGYVMTANGLVKVGGGTVDSGGGKGPGLAVPLLVTLATANPIGLAVGAAVKVTGEATGYSTVEGAAKRTADQIADRLKERFQQQGWI